MAARISRAFSGLVKSVSGSFTNGPSCRRVCGRVRASTVAIIAPQRISMVVRTDKNLIHCSTGELTFIGHDRRGHQETAGLPPAKRVGTLAPTWFAAIRARL